jgi:hypothetical protein
MVPSLTETLTEAAQTALTAEHQLDWEGFRDLFYPNSRRHHLEAIVAYGAYKRLPLAGPQPASEAARPKRAASTKAASLAEWEDEGGTSH